jgi:hypothetical protein
MRVIVVFSFFCCAALSNAEAPKNDLDIILSRFPGYHMLTLAERDSDTRAFILAHFPKRNPSVVHADFDRDGHLDYAVLLKDKKSETAKLVIFLCSGNTQCKSVHEVGLTSVSGAVYLRPVPIGSRVSQTDAIDIKDQRSPVKLSSPGIELTYFGKATVVYYWNRKHKKIEAVQTAD